MKARLEFEPTYFEAAVQHFSHYIIGVSLSLCFNDWIFYEIYLKEICKMHWLHVSKLLFIFPLFWLSFLNFILSSFLPLFSACLVLGASSLFIIVSFFSLGVSNFLWPIFFITFLFLISCLWQHGKLTPLIRIYKSSFKILQNLFIGLTLYPLGSGRHPWSNGYHRLKWTQLLAFKTWTRLFRILLVKAWVHLFSF